MPSTQPRVQLTVPDDLKQVYAEYAHHVGMPMATAIVALLAELAPNISIISAAIQAAKQGQPDAAADLTRKLLSDNTIQAGHAQHELDMQIAAAKKVARAAPPAAKKGARRK